MALPEGTKLGPYQIGAQIGAGGMGEVYRATDTRLDRTVAIKVLPEHLASDPSRRERFERGDLTAFVDTPAEEQGGVFSPDGGWVAFVSDRAEGLEVYVKLDSMN